MKNIFPQKCLRTLKPDRWISPKCFEKIPFGRLIPPFFCKSSESDRFSTIYMIRIRFFGPEELIQSGFSGGTARHMKTRERKGPSQSVIQHTGSHERSPYAPKFEDRSEEETLKTRTMRLQRRVGNMQRVLSQPKEKELHSSCLRRSTSAILNETRGKTICGRFRSLDAHAEQERSEFS